MASKSTSGSQTVQVQCSVDMEQTFAPTSMLVIPKMLINLMLNVFKHFMAMTLDIKDAFLMAAQPEDEKAYVEVDGKVYRLIRRLPGQRTAASQWFQLFTGAAKEFGMEQDIMQPTLLMIHKVIYITVHVDDVFMVGDEKAIDEEEMEHRGERTFLDGRAILLSEERLHPLQELVRHPL